MIAPVNSPALYSFIAYAPVRRFWSPTLQTGITFDPEGVTGPTAYHREALAEPHVLSYGYSPWLLREAKRGRFEPFRPLLVRGYCFSARLRLWDPLVTGSWGLPYLFVLAPANR